MGRFLDSGSYNQDCVYNPRWGDYTISWTVDYRYDSKRIRYPRRFSRDTDEAGAKRFCKRWNIPMPDKKE